MLRRHSRADAEALRAYEEGLIVLRLALAPAKAGAVIHDVAARIGKPEHVHNAIGRVVRQGLAQSDGAKSHATYSLTPAGVKRAEELRAEKKGRAA